MRLSEDTAEQLRRGMRKRALTQAAVAEALGTSQPWVSRVLAGLIDADDEALKRWVELAAPGTHLLPAAPDPASLEEFAIEEARRQTAERLAQLGR